MASMPNFLSDGEVEQMKQECARLVAKIDFSEKPTIFKTTGAQNMDKQTNKSNKRHVYRFETSIS